VSVLSCDSPVIEAAGLTVRILGGPPIIENVSFEARAGEVLGLVGESGAGKTTAALALLGYARPGTELVSGTVRVLDREVVAASRVNKKARGRLISYVPQNPSTALDPAIRVGQQVAEMARVHGVDSSEDKIAAAFGEVNLPTDRAFRRRFPHQLSGGQQQRVAIAIAFVCSARVVVLDEPTTGLDVVTKHWIVTQLSHLARDTDVAMIYVTHDLGVIARLADEVVVMYAGSIVERGTTEQVLRSPRHPYSLGLVSSVPDPVERRHIVFMPGIAVAPGEHPPGCAFAPRCAQAVGSCAEKVPELVVVDGEPHRLVRCPEWGRTPMVAEQTAAEDLPDVSRRSALLTVEDLTAHYGRRGASVVVGVSFEVARGERLAIVGESGSGKTTLARCLAGLHKPAGGTIALAGSRLATLARGRTIEQRRQLQIVFQNPYDSLNPHHRVRDIVSRPAVLLRGLSERDAQQRARELLEMVRLRRRVADERPAALSGGERQRVAIARALAADPSIIVCDEVTSALDVSVQAAVLESLVELGGQFELALVLITHDFGVVSQTADRVLVLQSGRVCEVGGVSEIVGHPKESYTRALIEAARSFSTANGRHADEQRYDIGEVTSGDDV
jgi:peptide/nickel transport system ATP-binding protein